MRERLQSIATLAAAAFTALSSCRGRLPAHSSQTFDAGPEASELYWYVTPDPRDAGALPRAEPLPAVLVRRTADGAVEAVDPRERLETPPPQLPANPPVWHEGLMLYVQHATDLRWPRPTGDVVGAVEAGVLVSVGPESGGWVPVATPFSVTSTRFFVAYVERSALSYHPAPREPRPHPEGIPNIGPGCVTRVVASTGEEEQIDFDRCTEIWLPGGDTGSQVRDGFELRLRDDCHPWFRDACSPRYTGTLFYCTIPAIAKVGESLFLSQEQRPPHPVTALPEGYLFTQPEQHRLRDAITSGGDLYWLVPFETGLECDEWHFANAAISKQTDDTTSIRARLVHSPKAWNRPGRFYPVQYEQEAGHLPHIRLAPMADNTWYEPGGYHYTLLREAEDGLHVTTSDLPEHVVGYRLDAAERWFLSKWECEAAARAAAVQLDADRGALLRLGLHSRQWSRKWDK